MTSETRRRSRRQQPDRPYDCRDQERGPTRSAVTASCARAIGCRADSALLLERGITVPQGRRKVERLLPEILGDERNGLAPRLRRLIADMREEWRGIDRRISNFDHELAERARAEETTCRLMKIPGIGVLTATALVAAVGNARTFTRGRNLAAWLGLVPRQATTGGKPKLLGKQTR
jgi:transposase